MRKITTLFVSLLVTLIVGCKKEGPNPIDPGVPIDSAKTTVLLEDGLFDWSDQSSWMAITMLAARATVSNPDSSVYIAMSETSPRDTFVILSHGRVNSMIQTTGIPIADYFWGIKAHFQKRDSARSTVDLYSNIGYYSIIDSITLEPYRLIGSSDTIPMTNRYLLYWKPNYRIDTLRFNVYFKPNLELTYDRFSTSSMSFAYKTASYDSSRRVARFTVGISTMSSEPNIVLQPFGKIEHVFENSYIKVISRFFYQQQRRVVPWLLP